MAKTAGDFLSLKAFFGAVGVKGIVAPGCS